MGKQEIGETATQCALRETREETGVTVKITGLLGIFSDPGHIVRYHSNGETRQEHEIIFLGEPVSGQPAANDEASAAGWYARAELPRLDIHPSQRRHPIPSPESDGLIPADRDEAWTSARRRLRQADQDIQAQVFLAEVLGVLAFHDFDAPVTSDE